MVKGGGRDACQAVEVSLSYGGEVALVVGGEEGDRRRRKGHPDEVDVCETIWTCHWRPQLDGEFDEEESKASFQAVLMEWRRGSSAAEGDGDGAGGEGGEGGASSSGRRAEGGAERAADCTSMEIQVSRSKRSDVEVIGE